MIFPTTTTNKVIKAHSSWLACTYEHAHVHLSHAAKKINCVKQKISTQQYICQRCKQKERHQ